MRAHVDRYDAFRRDAAPPIPPLVIFSPANPFALNPRWMEDVRLLVVVASAAFDAGDEASIPPYTPLGHGRGDVPCSVDLPAWARPEIHCDPSGAPQVRCERHCKASAVAVARGAVARCPSRRALGTPFLHRPTSHLPHETLCGRSLTSYFHWPRRGATSSVTACRCPCG